MANRDPKKCAEKVSFEDFERMAPPSQGDSDAGFRIVDPAERLSKIFGGSPEVLEELRRKLETEEPRENHV